jgi:hypothetical protein
MPAIRSDKWQKVYDSIQLDFPWELIIVAPYDNHTLPRHNVKYIQDFGSPVRASCIGANLANGKYLTWIADDGILFSETVIKAINILDNNINGRLVVVTKYLEACAEVHPDSYYKLNNAYPRSPYIPDDWWIFNTAIMHTDYYDYLGGWDSCYETTAIAHADLAIRAQRDGCETIMLPEPLLNCEHGHSDHRPIEESHVGHDEPIYKEIYGSYDCVNRTRININNWKKSAAIWRRFQ